MTAVYKYMIVRYMKEHWVDSFCSSSVMFKTVKSVGVIIWSAAGIIHFNVYYTGSPFLLNVAGEPSGRVRETVSREMEQAEAVQAGTRCEFLLKIPGNRLWQTGSVKWCVDNCLWLVSIGRVIEDYHAITFCDRFRSTLPECISYNRSCQSSS